MLDISVLGGDLLHVIPKADSPYLAHFPTGIPVTMPLPIGICKHGLVWDLDLDRISELELEKIAELIADDRGMDAGEVLSGIQAEGKIGVTSQQNVRVVGNPQIERMSIDEIEGLARSYRARVLLESSPIVINLKLTILDALIIYGELKHAVWILLSNNPQSETGKIVGHWIENIPIAIRRSRRYANEPFAPELVAAIADNSSTPEGIRLSILDLEIDRDLDIPIGCYTAYLTIGCLQLMLRKPNSQVDREIRSYIRTLSSGVLQVASEVEWLLERGWHPEFDGVPYGG